MPMSIEDMRRELEDREGLLAELLEARAEAEAGERTDRAALQTRVTKYLKSMRKIHDSSLARYNQMGKQADAAKAFLKEVKDEDGVLDPEKLFREIDGFQQTVFGHALTLVSANGDCLNTLIQNLSRDHRDAIDLLISRKSKEGDSKLHEEISRLTGELDSLRRAAENSENTIESLRQRNRSEVERGTELSERVNNLSRDLDALKEKAESLTGDLTTWKRKAADLEGSLDSAKNEAETSSRDLETAKKRVRHLENDLTAARTESAQLRDGSNSLRQQFDKDLAAANAEAKQLKDNSDSSKRQFDKDLATANAKMKQLQDSLDSSAKNVDKLKKDLADSKEHTKSARDDASGLRHRNSELSTNLEDAKKALLDAQNSLNLLDFAFDTERDESEDKAKQKDGEISNLQAQLATRIGLSREQQTAVSKLRRELEDKKSRALEEKRSHTEVSKTAKNRIRDLQSQLRARDVGLAEILASQSGWVGPDYDCWLPLVEAATGAGDVAAHAAEPKPWELLRVWGRDEEQARDLLLSRDSLFGKACVLYRCALEASYGGEPTYLLEGLKQHLAEDGEAPVRLVLLVVRKYLEVVPHATDATQTYFFFGLWQATSLVAKRWPTNRDAEETRQRLERCLEGSALAIHLDTILRDSYWEGRLREERPSQENRIFCDDSRTCLVTAPGVPDWVLAVDPAQRSVRMIHKARGAWDDLDKYKIGTTSSGQDLTIQVRSQEDFGWIVRHFEPL